MTDAQEQPMKHDSLRKGNVISYTVPGTNLVFHGSIIHIGSGLAARNAVLIRCTDGYNRGQVECVMLEHILGVMSYA